MIYSTFLDLPEFLKKYIREFMDDKAEDWVLKPIPALKGRSVINLLNEEGLQSTVDFLLKVGSQFGVPYTLKLP